MHNNNYNHTYRPLHDMPLASLHPPPAYTPVNTYLQSPMHHNAPPSSQAYNESHIEAEIYRLIQPSYPTSTPSDRPIRPMKATYQQMVSHLPLAAARSEQVDSAVQQPAPHHRTQHSHTTELATTSEFTYNSPQQPMHDNSNNTTATEIEVEHDSDIDRQQSNDAEDVADLFLRPSTSTTDTLQLPAPTVQHSEMSIQTSPMKPAEPAVKLEDYEQLQQQVQLQQQQIAQLQQQLLESQHLKSTREVEHSALQQQYEAERAEHQQQTQAVQKQHSFQLIEQQYKSSAVQNEITALKLQYEQHKQLRAGETDEMQVVDQQLALAQNEKYHWQHQYKALTQQLRTVVDEYETLQSTSQQHLRLSQQLQQTVDGHVQEISRLQAYAEEREKRINSLLGKVDQLIDSNSQAMTMGINAVTVSTKQQQLSADPLTAIATRMETLATENHRIARSAEGDSSKLNELMQLVQSLTEEKHNKEDAMRRLSMKVQKIRESHETSTQQTKQTIQQLQQSNTLNTMKHQQNAAQLSTMTSAMNATLTKSQSLLNNSKASSKSTKQRLEESIAQGKADTMKQIEKQEPAAAARKRKQVAEDSDSSDVDDAELEEDSSAPARSTSHTKSADKPAKPAAPSRKKVAKPAPVEESEPEAVDTAGDFTFRRKSLASKPADAPKAKATAAPSKDKENVVAPQKPAATIKPVLDTFEVPEAKKTKKLFNPKSKPVQSMSQILASPAAPAASTASNAASILARRPLGNSNLANTGNSFLSALVGKTAGFAGATNRFAFPISAASSNIVKTSSVPSSILLTIPTSSAS